MTIHAPFPGVAQGGRVDPRPVPLRVVALSPARTAVFFDAPADAAGVQERLTVIRDGRPVDGPVLAARLQRSEERIRHVLIIAQPAPIVCRSRIKVSASGNERAFVDPLRLQTPLVDPLALVEDLEPAGALRLLKLFLTTGASLFDKGGLGGFGLLVGHLVEGLATRPVRPSVWCPVGARSGVLTYRVPVASDAASLRHFCLISDGRARRFTAFRAVSEMAGGEHLLHILLDAPLPASAELVALSGEPLRLAAPAGSSTPRPLAPWFAARTPAVRAAAAAWLERAAVSSAEAASLRDELDCPHADMPEVTPIYLGAAGQGLLYMIGLHDPRGLLSEVRLDLGAASCGISSDSYHWHPECGPVLAGYAALNGRAEARATVTLVFRSGRSRKMAEAEIARLDGGIPLCLTGLPPRLTAPILARALPAGMAARPVPRWRAETFGRAPRAPSLAVIAEAADAPEHLHTLLAALAAEPGGRDVEVVVLHADGQATPLLRQTAEQVQAVYRGAIRLVSVAPPAMQSEMVRAALAGIRAPAALFLAAGCLPQSPRWLRPWRRRLHAASGAVAVGAPVLRFDGSLEATGASFGAGGWRDVAPGRRDRAVDQLRGCIGLNAAAIAQLLGARPTLPGVAADISATPGLTLRQAGRRSFVSYQAAPFDPLSEVIERHAIAEARGTLEAGDV